MSLTKKFIDATEPQEKPVFYWDDQPKGFGLKVLPSGKKVFVAKYRANGGGRSAKQRWLTIGAYGQITLEQARQLARQAFASVANGEDPQADKLRLRESPKLADVWKRFQEDELHLKKPATIRDYSNAWRDLIGSKLGSMRVKDLNRDDIERFHKSLMSTPYRANRVLSLLSKLMNLAEAWGWRDQGTNPCKYVKKFKEQSRERYLTKDEITRLRTAMKELVAEGAIWPDMANAIVLLLLTGARKNEILTCEWSWVSFEHQAIFLPDSKTGKKQIDIGDAAQKLLRLQKQYSHNSDSKYVFPGKKAGQPLVNLSKPWRLICERAEIEGVRIHDLRHTHASIGINNGASLQIIGRLLGHKQTQTTARYAHVDSDPALKVANLIGDFISATDVD